MLDAQNTMPIKDNAAAIKSPPKSKQDAPESAPAAGQKYASPPKQQQQQRPSIDVKDVLLKGGIVSSADGDELMLEVTCGQNQAALYMSRLQLGSKGTCVLFENAWLTPNEFQYISGRETAKDWKRSIKHHGKSLKVLIAKGILTTNPLRCNCGQCSTQIKDIAKYGVTVDVAAGKIPLREPSSSYLMEMSKLKPPDKEFVVASSPSKVSSMTTTTSKNDADRLCFKIPVGGETNETSPLINETSKRRSLLLNGQQLLVNSHSLDGARFPLVNSHSLDGARYPSNNNNDHEALEKNALLNGHVASTKSERKERGELKTTNVSSSSSDLEHSVVKRLEVEGQKRSPDATDAKVKAKKSSKTEGNDVIESGHFRESFASNVLLCPSNDVWKSSSSSSSSTAAETVNDTKPSSDAMETNAASGGTASTAYKKSGCGSTTDKSRGSDAMAFWNRSTGGGTQDQTPSSYRSAESTNKSNEKTTKKVSTVPHSSSSSSSSSSSASDRSGQSTTVVSGKHSTTLLLGGGGGGDSAPGRTLHSTATTAAVAEPPYVFPSFAAPYYPMIAAPQLPAYYPSPYMWPAVSFPQPPSCSYGWTPPSDLPGGPNCLRSSSQYKELADSVSTPALSHHCAPTPDGSVFNFPWMKQQSPDVASGCSNGPAESYSQLLRHDSLLPPSGKRKLQDDPANCYPPSKHPCSFLPDAAASRQMFGDSMNWAAAGYNPAAFDLRGFMTPYNISSYIPDARAAVASSQNAFLNSFLKASEMSASHHHASLNLYPNLFSSSSHCLGVSSR